MIRQALGILTASILLVVGCGESQSPTEPTPASSAIPIVLSARAYYSRSEWIIRGSHFTPNPRATLEAAGAVIRVSVSDDFRDDYVIITIPSGTASGAYKPCVTTVNGKGCGSFELKVR
jgi:hypothetical protein